MSHGVYMDIMWFLCGHNIVTTWTPVFPGGHHMVSMWLPCTFHVHTMWFPGGHHNISNVDTI